MFVLAKDRKNKLNRRIIMKMNKNELTHMINQIDDDLLYEATEEYRIPHFCGWKRVIPVAACITLLVLGAAVSVLRNITIDRGHESIEGTAISEHKGDTGKEDTLDDSEKSYIIQMDSERNTISSVLDLVTASFGEKGVSEKLVIESMEIRLLPKDNTILNGRITLTDMEYFRDITVSISQSKIIIDMENNSTLQEQTKTALNPSSAGESVSKINWYDFCKAADYVPELTGEFKDSVYMTVSAELVALVSNIDAISEDIPVIIYDGDLKEVENRDELKDMTYSYAFFLHTSVVPEIISKDILVYIK